MKPETFYNLLAEQNLPLSDQQKKQFERYFELLVEWNEKINLTAITDKEEVYLKHFYDSIAPILQGLIPNETIKLLVKILLAAKMALSLTVRTILRLQTQHWQ